jgi:hypothetical protein
MFPECERCLAEAEDPRAHLAALDVARGDVVEDHITGDVVHRLLGPEPLAGLPDHHRQFELVVELLRQVLRIDDRLVGPDDRVDILEEHDPRRDLMRPVDVLRVVFVLSEVAGGVEELLRHDRRTQLRRGQRGALGRVVGAAALEVLAHARDVEADDLVAVDAPDLAVVVGHQLHALSCLSLFRRPSSRPARRRRRS